MNQENDPTPGSDPETISANATANEATKSGQDSSGSNQADPEKKEPTIHLDQFLKTCGVATGGQAKVMIQAGEVLVNNEVETRRRKQLRVGDEVTLGDTIYVVALNE